ncbi:hypothetical protein [Spirillospora sp. CA-128828]|uniref:hypothetical protein n=1 Tax=Spirillospora sp. CA-128828 TaxID=3240033 RepID=UPI003D8AE48E
MSSWAIGAFAGSAFSGMTMTTLGRKILHLGLALMAAGLVALYAVFEAAGTGVGGWHLAAPLLLFGAGMGMIFVPLFDIIVAGIADHEVGSGSAALESVQQLGASLGIAILGTVFFGAIGTPVAGHFAAAAALDAAKQVTALTVGLTAAAFLVAFLLPRHARAH